MEHENYARGSCNEMNKLQLFNSPLKVLITYARPGFGLEEHLERYTKIVRWADAFGDFTIHRRQLVVFGDMPLGIPEWRGYAYESNGFVQIGGA